MSDISRSINKQDTNAKTSGSIEYISDMKIEGALHARTLRSTMARARITNIEFPEIPTGYYIVDRSDVPGMNRVKIIFDDMPVFAEEEVRHIGEPILLVVGEDRAVIKEIIDGIKVEYEPLVPEFGYVNSVIHYDYEKGDGEKYFKDGSRIITGEYKTGYQEHIYLEPQGIIGIFEDGKSTVIGSMQCPYYIKNAVVQALGIENDKVRIQQAATGGAFGGKEEFPSLIGCQVAVASMKIGRPVRLIYDRVEDIESTTKRHPSLIKFKAAVDEDNNIRAMKVHVSLDSGAYIGLSGVVLQRAMIAASGVYTIDNLSVSGDVFETNTVPNGAFRGFGAPQMFFAIEMFINHVAQELGEDNLEFRSRHLAKQGEATSTGGHFRDPIIMNKMIDKVMEMSDYKTKRKQYSAKDDFRGIGMSWYLHGCGFTGSGEQKHIKAVVRLRKEKDNTVTVLAANTEMGQGAFTTLRKIAAGVLEIPVERVIYNNPDTDLVPDSGPTVASRTIMIVGGLIARAALKLKEQWVDGEEILIEERYKQPDYVEWDDETLTGDAYPAYSWGVNVAEVEVDKATYEVNIRNLWGVYDIGKAIDERIIIGQIEGGLLQGVAYGTIEVMDTKDGRIRQRNVTDYIIPTACDCAPVETVIMDNPFPLGPYGAKGAGELPLVGGAPAVALAIENAIGKKVMKIPATPEYIMELLEND
ncbi:MAG: xanthine dehydrogenase family protein [Clostridia bacterium]|nr:xanthine dehydrogenase family protein [Clostridia bacterium]MBN2883258.1 xanthine dehydrogenase family protein [Clostridia bacterium]